MEEVLRPAKGTYADEGIYKGSDPDNERGVARLMAKKKTKTPAKTTKSKAPMTAVPKERKDPRIEETYYEEVTFMCPKRGLVKQKVKIKRFKAAAVSDAKNLLIPLTELASQLEEKDDGMSIYSDGEDLGLIGESE